jgi:methionyl-tRNA formyltransferase
VPPQNVLLTVSFGELIPPELMSYFHEHQRLNLHPSLLPSLVGAAPIQRAIARQHEKTGVTVQTLGEMYDSGDILAQEEAVIPPQSTYASLGALLAKQGADLVVETLRKLPELAKNARPQSKEEGVPHTKAYKLEVADSNIKWSKWTAQEIDARHRGYGYLVSGRPAR